MFSTKRYWGEDRYEPKGTFTLEALHQLAQQRSREREKRQLHDSECDNGSIDRTKLRLKQMKLSEKGDGRKSASQKVDHKCNGSLESTIKDDSLRNLDKRCSASLTSLDLELLDSECEEEEDNEDSSSGSVSGENQKNAENPDKPEVKIDVEDNASLAPLSHDMSRNVVERRTVHRQLPEWIINAHVIENDIQQFSKPIEEFSINSVLVQNLSSSNIENFFPVQAHVIPYLLSTIHGPLRTGAGGCTPCDVCVCAPTGCGKTLCYVLPIVTALMNRVSHQIRALVVVPSKELASQVVSVFQQVSHGTGISSGMVCGQVSMELECAILRESGSYPPSSKVDVLVATPGRLVEHLNSGSFHTLRFLRFLVIDEADKLLDYHFNRWLPKLLQAVSHDKATPSGCCLNRPSLEKTFRGLCGHPMTFELLSSSCRRDIPKHSNSRSALPQHLQPPSSPLQKLLFSATMTQNPEHFALLGLHQPKLFTISNAVPLKGPDSSELIFGLPEQLVERRVRCELRLKPLALLRLITGGCRGQEQGEMEKVLCFTNSKDSTHRLHLLLKAFDLFPVAEVSGSVNQGQRLKALSDFKSGKVQMLICSDQMARGMDVEGVTCVVSYEPPRQFRIYLHRAGRTARAGQRGVVYSLLSYDEVHAFNVMMRQVKNRKEMDDLKISSSDLQDYLPQYQDALDSLRQQL